MGESLRQRLADLNDYYDDVMKESARRRNDEYDPKTLRYYHLKTLGI